jgi:hypothetical protein
MSKPDDSRLVTELELFEAMYPGQVTFDQKGRDLKFLEESALLHLRIPESYPEEGLPGVLSASDASKTDLRNCMKDAIGRLGLAPGEEALDAIIACFQSMIAETDHSKDSPQADPNRSNKYTPDSPEPSKTVIIWLHHLLALGKRKLAVSPSRPLSGITKPGYPGIMVFSGAASAVDDHVHTLKAQNWQAFQVRYEEAVAWEFARPGVEEVETMAEVAKHIEVGLHGAERKEEFLRAAGIK